MNGFEALAVEALREQQHQIEALRSENQEQRDRIEAMRSEVASIASLQSEVETLKTSLAALATH